MPHQRFERMEVIGLSSSMIEVGGSEHEAAMKEPPTDDAVRARAESLGPERWVTHGLIEETIRVWEPRYGRKIGPEEAALILTRVVEFVRVLAEHSQHVDAGDRGEKAARNPPGDTGSEGPVLLRGLDK
jgi:hypothetical protein